MRLTVLTQTAKGAPETIGTGEDQYELRSKVLKQLESIKWYLWHGNVFQALHRLQDLEMDLDAAACDNTVENPHCAPLITDAPPPRFSSRFVGCKPISDKKESSCLAKSASLAISEATRR
jgi:hypothetical protein